MRLSKSWARQEYNNHYRWMRRGFSFEKLVDAYPDQEETVKKADYSYQACGYEPNGWSSHRRYRAFLHMKWRIITRREVYPF